MNRPIIVAMWLTLVAICPCLVVPSALAQQCPRLANIMTFPSPETSSIAVSDGYAYTVSCNQSGTVGAFKVIDVHSPSDPTEVGFLDVCADDIVISGRYAYVSQSDFGSFEWMVRVIDVSEPTSPAVVVSLEELGRIGAVSDGYAYTTDFLGGLRIIDVSDPTSPVQVGFLERAPNDDYFTDVEVSGGFAYVTGGRTHSPYSGSLRIVDVSDPTAPIELGRVSVTYDLAYDVAVQRGYAYVASQSGQFVMPPHGMSVVDVSNASAPVVMANIDWYGGVSHLAVSGRLLFRATSTWINDSGSLHVYDVSDPAEPVEVASLCEGYCREGGDPVLKVFGKMSDVGRSGRYVYTAGEDGLLVFDTWGCNHPRMPATYE